MSQLTSGEPDPAELRSALATLVAEEPALPSGADDIEQRGRRRLARRRFGTGLAAAVVVAAGLAATGLPGLGSRPDSSPDGVIAAPTTAAVDGQIDGSGAAGGTQLAGFTVTAAVTAVAPVLPATVSVGELPVDVGWRDGGMLDLPLVGATGGGTITLQIAGGACTATASPATVLAPADLDAIADAVCAAWVAAGSPEIVPAGPSGVDQPELANK